MGISTNRETGADSKETINLPDEPPSSLPASTMGNTGGSAVATQSLAVDKSPTGPRTPAGKERSRHNALKHGIFSTVAVLPHESRTEFNSLLNGLREDLQPEGTLEGILVEKLAVLSWRYRRLVVAEAAEIQKRSAFLEWDNKERRDDEASEGIVFTVHTVGLIKKKNNPLILEKCTGLLKELKDNIQSNGFDSDSDELTLTELYGDLEQHAETLLDTYRAWHATAECSDEERKQNGYASAEQCVKNFLKELENEIRNLARYKKAKAAIETEQMNLEVLRQSVPDSPEVERLLRYETTLERAFDRTLTQLERLQRMRLGQPVSAPIKLSLS
jgi:hypothetical protein